MYYLQKLLNPDFQFTSVHFTSKADIVFGSLMIIYAINLRDLNLYYFTAYNVYIKR
uniref:Uncharacterized protein n=1 Tax=Ascaris lumbricoides TaxID=6252 RepID=A0A0M3IHZ4_ASCLU